MRPTQEQHDSIAEEARERGLPDPPARPVPGECCERGCDPCIWDWYARALSRYRERHGVSAGAEEPLR